MNTCSEPKSREESILAAVCQLHENLRSIESVLEGTWCIVALEGKTCEKRQSTPVEFALDEIYGGLQKALEQTQGMRERLQKVVARLV